MSRKPRLFYSGALYHVIVRGNAKQAIFLGDSDRLQYQKYIDEGLSDNGHRLHAYCLMSNHSHLLLQAGETPISRMMQVVSQRYTQWFNKKYDRVGHLFQGRYKALLVDADSYLLELIRYIHLNPLRAGVVDSLEQYRWSSHHAYLGLDELPWLTTEWALRHFGEDLDTARTGYQRFLGENPDEKMVDQLSSGTAEGRLLGDDTFIREVTEVQAEPTGKKLECTLDDIARLVASEEGVSLEELTSRSQRRQASHARAMIALFAVDHAGLPVTDVANRLSRHPTVISRQLRQVREQLLSEETNRRVRKYLNLLKLQA